MSSFQRPTFENPTQPRGGRTCLVVGLLIHAGLLAQFATAEPPADLELIPLITNGLSRPVLITHAGDRSGRLFIVEQAGRIRIFDGNRLATTPFLDISPRVHDSGNEQGLLGLAFHPDYSNNGRFYVNYTESEPNPPQDCLDLGADCNWNTVIERFQVSGNDPDLANVASGVRILVINQDYSNHNGGGIAFGPDGHLYIGMGDGGSGGDPENRAQSKDTLLGKILRIDVDGGGFPADCGSVGNYGVPANNPFRDGAGGDCDEIWALGLRNPWRWSFDRDTGDMFIGDVGQNTWEEVDYEPWSSIGGLNYGWRCYEGDHPYNTNGCGSPSQYEFPIFEYDQRLFDRAAVTGGYVYRGPTIGGLQGWYAFADYRSGEVWFTLPDSQGNWNTQLWKDVGLVISSFGEDEAGELYLVHLNGSVYRFDSPSSIFGDPFESGNTSAWSSTQP